MSLRAIAARLRADIAAGGAFEAAASSLIARAIESREDSRSATDSRYRVSSVSSSLRCSARIGLATQSAPSELTCPRT